MTLPPEKIGDKDQRYLVKYSSQADATDDERKLAFAETLESAEKMAAAWRTHPAGYFVWIEDRQASVVNERSAI